MASWPTNEEIRNLWQDAPQDENTLELIRLSAIAQIEAFAPALPPAAPVPAPTGYGDLPFGEGPFGGVTLPTPVSIPANYKLAVLYQIRNLWNASRQSSGNDNEFTPTIYPLDWHVENLLRPKRVLGLVG